MFMFMFIFKYAYEHLPCVVFDCTVIQSPKTLFDPLFFSGRGGGGGLDFPCIFPIGSLKGSLLAAYWAPYVSSVMIVVWGLLNIILAALLDANIQAREANGEAIFFL